MNESLESAVAYLRNMRTKEKLQIGVADRLLDMMAIIVSTWPDANFEEPGLSDDGSVDCDVIIGDHKVMLTIYNEKTK